MQLTTIEDKLMENQSSLQELQEMLTEAEGLIDSGKLVWRCTDVRQKLLDELADDPEAQRDLKAAKRVNMLTATTPGGYAFLIIDLERTDGNVLIADLMVSKDSAVIRLKPIYVVQAIHQGRKQHECRGEADQAEGTVRPDSKDGVQR